MEAHVYTHVNMCTFFFPGGHMHMYILESIGPPNDRNSNANSESTTRFIPVLLFLYFLYCYFCVYTLRYTVEGLS